MMKVEVVPHNPNWHCADLDESKRVAMTLGKNVKAIHHIGCTAIPTIHAKPIIDILIEVRKIDQVDARNNAMKALGYESMGEFGISGRRYFRKHSDVGTRTHHIHVFRMESDQVRRHLAFRDYLRVHTEDTQQYSSLKQQLAQQYPNDIEGYMDGKNEFIHHIDQRAAAWHRRSQRKG